MAGKAGHRNRVETNGVWDGSESISMVRIDPKISRPSTSTGNVWSKTLEPV